jgi:CHAD domain-containing protein
MEQGTLDAVIRRQFEKCRRTGKGMAKNFGVEDIHQFRVATKRLRALLRLAAASGHSHISPKLPRNLKVYYRMAGVLRMLQLQKMALEEAAVRMHQGFPAKCIALLDDRIGVVENMIRLYLGSSRPFGGERAEWHDPLTSRTSKAAKEAFIAVNVKACSPPDPAVLPDDEGLHTIRKAMKDLLYGWPFFSKEEIENAIPEGLPARTHLETCERLLGNFHDIVVVLSLFRDKSFLLCTCPHSARFLEGVEQLWLSDKRALLEKMKDQFLTKGGTSIAGGEGEDRNNGNPMGAPNLNMESYELHVE